MTRLKTSLLTIAVLLCSLATSAHDFEVDGIYYNITSDSDLTVSVTYRGSFYGSYANAYPGSVVIPEKVTYNGNEYSVTSIGQEAFHGCSGLTSVDIPNSVTSIGIYAFYGCSGLTSVTIPNSVTSIGYEAFSRCSGLTSIKVDSGNTKYDSRDNCNAIIETNTNTLIVGCKNTVIPNSVTSIGIYAFYGCSGLTSVTIPNSVTSIGYSAFSGCSGMTAVHITDLSAWCKIKFINFASNPTYYAHHLYLNGEEITKLVIPDDVTSIGIYAFYGCSGLTSVTIPNSVTSIGYDAFYNCSGLTSVTIPNSVTSIGNCAFSGCSGLTTIEVESGNTKYDSRDNCNAIIETNTNTLIVGCKNTVIPNSVTSLGYGAFRGYSSLTSVTIPNSVTSIGSHAFSSCSSLTSVTIPNSVTSIGDWAFSSCSALTNVTIPNSVTSIGSYAFYGCSGLTSVTIPNSVTSIERSAFEDCSGLTSVTIPNSVTSIGEDAFYGTGWYNNHSDGVLYLDNWLIDYKGTMPANTSINIKDGTKGIAESAFYGCSGLTSVTIPNSVTSIGFNAFSDCSGLTNVTIPNSVTSIERSAFSGTGWYNDHSDGILYLDSWLIGYKGDKPTGTLEIKEGTRGIANSAFSGCSGLTNVTIPNSVTSLGYAAFRECSGLTSVTIGNSVTSIGEDAFYNCSGLTSVTIGNSVTSIGEDAFYWCSGLTSVTIPNSVTSIGNSAFSHCSGLTSVTIPDSVTSIGSSAFYGCSRLTSVTIPNSVTSIGEYAFRGCSRLTSVTVEHSSPLPVEYNTFALYKNGEYITNNATLYVPYGSAAAYQSSEGWSTFTRIEEMPGAQFVIPETAAYPDEQFSLPVEMANTAELTAFQCDVYIPEGLTLQTDDKGRYDITLSSERCDDHTLSALLQSDGSIRIAMYSMSTSPILGTEGPLFTLNMSAGEELSAYEVQIKNIHASDASGKLYSMADVTGTVTVDYRAGDANGDGMVAVNDVVYTVNKILNNAAEDFIFSAADMNDDNEIMINDVVMIVNTILGTSTTTAALAPRHMNAFETLSVADSRTAYGMTEFGITLSNASRYTAMQFDMELADGADIADIKVSMPTDHSVAYRRIDDTTVRVVVTSLTNEALAEGAQLSISMKDAAGKTVAFTNGRAAYNNGQMVGIMPGSTVLGGTTGIDGVNAEFAPADVYSIDGKVVNKNVTTLDGLQPGVYVVNGRKVVVEK